jgi:TRAP-type C4-dicarboxylate transport system permease small subunit
MFQKISDSLNKITEIVVMVLMAAISVIIFGQVVCRYVFNHSLYWSEEVGRYILVWITFLGASVGVKRYAHIGIDFLYNKARGFFKKIIDFAIVILGIFFAGIICYFGYRFSYFVRFQKSAALLMPMTIPYASICVGGFLMLIHFFSDLIKIFRKKRTK